MLGIVDPLPEALGAFLLGVLIVHPLRARAAAAQHLARACCTSARSASRARVGAAFALDRLKAVAIGSVLTGRRARRARLLRAGVPVRLAARCRGRRARSLVLLLSFVAPVVLEPIFNKFRPLEDSEPARRGAAARRRCVGVPGAGGARRRREQAHDEAERVRLRARRHAPGRALRHARRAGEQPEILTVVAHELGHRRYRHVAFGTAVAMGGVAAYVRRPLGTALLPGGAGRHRRDRARATPRSPPSRCSSASLLGIAAAPLQAALSRRWEYACDRFALEQTGDLGAFESAFGRLSEANLPDPAPPRLAYLWLFSHPTVPERVAAARRVAALATVPA